MPQSQHVGIFFPGCGVLGDLLATMLAARIQACCFQALSFSVPNTGFLKVKWLRAEKVAETPGSG